MSCVFPLLSHLHRDLFKGSFGRAVSISLILILAGGSGTPVFALRLAGGRTALPLQATSWSRFAPTLGISKSGGAGQQLENRGMPPNPPQSEAIRPERPQRKSDREARVARLVLNLKDSVTLTEFDECSVIGLVAV
jgi:hypothetical protein